MTGSPSGGPVFESAFHTKASCQLCWYYAYMKAAGGRKTWSMKITNR